ASPDSSGRHLPRRNISRYICMAMDTHLDTTRKRSAIPSRSAGDGGWRPPLALLCAYVAIELVIVAILALGVGRLHLRLFCPEVAVWLLLVAAVAAAWRPAWILLSGFTVIGLLSTGVILANQPRTVGTFILLLLMTIQAVILLNRRFRYR